MNGINFGWLLNPDGQIGQNSETNEAQTAATSAQNFSAAEAEKNREYQTEMSNTAYQRATADMEKAGINPLLAFQQGGASTPSGAQGSGYQAQAQTSAQTKNTNMNTLSQLVTAAAILGKLL